MLNSIKKVSASACHAIHSSTPLAALIRTQLGCLRKTDLRNVEKTTKHQRQQTENDFANTMAARIAAIDADDPQRKRKAFGLFLESVLLAELGENLSKDPAFYAMAEKIQGQIEADPDMAELMHMASQILLEQASRCHAEKR